jgi:hypothetical protein
MSVGSRLNQLEAHLNGVIEKLVSVDEYLLRNPDSRSSTTAADIAPARLALIRERIEPLGAQLLLVARELSSIGHLLDMKQRIAVKVPLQHRWQKRQSINDHGRHHQRIYQKLQEIQESLNSTFIRMTDPSKHDLRTMSVELIQNSFNPLQQQEALMILTSKPTIKDNSLTTQNVSFEALAISAYILWLAIQRMGPKR